MLYNYLDYNQHVPFKYNGQDDKVQINESHLLIF